MKKSKWKETDRFHVKTDSGEIYAVIEETEYMEIKDKRGKASVRGRTRHRTAENHKVHKIGEHFTFDTSFGPMFAERLNQDETRRSSGIIWRKGQGMQFTIEIYPQKQFAYIKATGQVTPRIFREALMNSFWNDKFDPTFAQLIDLSEIEGFPVVDEAYDVRDVFRVMKNILKGKIAVLTVNAGVHSMAKLVSLLASKEGFELEVFKDLDKAKEWLGVK